jgi:ectoine hydroxylase-related dioxygenase (phytanoyl-CoA dioxygenase family)
MNDVGGPFPLAMSGDDVAAATRSIVEDVLPTAPRRNRLAWLAGLLWRREWGSIELLRFQWRTRHFFMERHLDSLVVRRLCNDPRLRQQLAAYLGDDLVLWRSEIWLSRPDECLIPDWHHDAYPLLLRGEGRTINAYIALTEVEADNGFEYLPSSLQAGPRLEEINVDRRSGNAFLRVPPDLERAAVPVRLRAGEFVLFPDDLIHRSVRNTSGRTRVSLTLRVATPSLRILRGYSSTFEPVAL